MKTIGAFLVLLYAVCSAPLHASPVLVELFTSEGCSSCPPADRLLEKLQGADVIVLSEHVDYWNHIGWTDPYSSARYSRRQKVYAERFHLDSVYTPQMVVDGAAEFVGSDATRARAAIANAAKSARAIIRVSPGSTSGRVLVEVDALGPRADVYLAVASNEELSQVLRGENGGHSLHHVAVVRSLRKIGTTTGGAAFSKELDLTLLTAVQPANLRVVVFAQAEGQGKVLGSAMMPSPHR